MRIPHTPRYNRAMSNVLHFGAKGDGKTDDTAAIEHTLKQGDGVLEFPRGNYLITKTITIHLNDTGRCAITGSGATAKIIMAGQGPAFHIIGTHAGTASPLSFKPEVWAAQRMPTVTQIEIEGPAQHMRTQPGTPAPGAAPVPDTATPGAVADGFRIEGTMQATFEGVLLRNLRHGIHITKRNRNIIISHCHIYHNTGIGIYLDAVNLHQINITGSHISYNRQGGIRSERSEIRNFQITGNDIEYNNHNSFPGFKPEPTAEILIDASAPGATVREGTIASNTIQATYSPGGANIRFIGGAEKAGDREQGTGNSADGNRKAGMWSITGNLIGSQEVNLHLQHTRGIVVTGNFIYSGHQRNILIQHSKNIALAGNCFEHNPDYREKELCTGVRLEHCENVTFTGSILHDCQAGKHTVPTEAALNRDGLLEIVKCKRVTLAGCQILDGVPHGLFIDDSHQVQVTGCTILDTREPKLSKASVEVKGAQPVMTGNVLE